ncbi:amidohydrolase, partial [Corynebacterium sp. UMB8791]
MTTMSGIVSIAIRGRGGHSSNPQLSIDPVLIASQATLMLNTIVSRDVDPKHMNIVNVGSLHS